MIAHGCTNPVHNGSGKYTLALGLLLLPIMFRHAEKIGGMTNRGIDSSYPFQNTRCTRHARR